MSCVCVSKRGGRFIRLLQWPPQLSGALPKCELNFAKTLHIENNHTTLRLASTQKSDVNRYANWKKNHDYTQHYKIRTTVLTFRGEWWIYYFCCVWRSSCIFVQQAFCCVSKCDPTGRFFWRGNFITVIKCQKVDNEVYTQGVWWRMDLRREN